jgi:adenylate kinase
VTRQVVALTGLSGVGKSMLTRSLAASIPLEHLQASTLIKEGRIASNGTAYTQDQLRLDDIDENQQLLIQGFRLKAESITGLTVLDSHTVIERGDGLIRIDARVFAAVGTRLMIFLTDDPKAIAARRRSDMTRQRPLPDVETLRFIQEEARQHAAAICRAIDIPLHIFHPDQSALIVHVLQENIIWK